jgi:hypothetical protein
MTEPGAALALTAKLPPARLDALTRELARDLSRTGKVKARPAEAVAGPGERGVAAKIGEILFDAVGGGVAKAGAEAVKAAAEVIKAYLLREKSLSIVLTRPDGGKIEINAKNVSVEAIAAALAAVQAAKA